MPNDILLVTLSHREDILAHNLASSPCLRDGSIELKVIPDATSVGEAHNRALDDSDADIVAFIHHDVFLPRGWDSLLRARIAQVAAMDPDWALIGAFGVGTDHAEYGPVWSTSLGRVVGRVASCPVAVQSFDELMVVLRRDSGLRFDAALPGFHLWGTDIVAQARTTGLGAWVCPLPLVHNDAFHGHLDHDFGAAYAHLRRKWRARLPMRSPIIGITWHGANLHKARWKNRRSQKLRYAMAQDTGCDPFEVAMRCGWSDLESVAEWVRNPHL